jgi:Nitrile hydratase, alpha chain
MTFQNGPTGRGVLEQRLVRRANSDPAFRALLLTDPRSAIAEELDVTLPETLEVVVVEERPDRLCLVLPMDLSGMSAAATWAMMGRRPETARDGR